MERPCNHPRRRSSCWYYLPGGEKMKWLALLILIILFAGEPDLHDVIMDNLTGSSECKK